MSIQLQAVKREDRKSTDSEALQEQRIIESQKRVRDAFADFIEVWKSKRLIDASKSRPSTMGLFKRTSA